MGVRDRLRVLCHPERATAELERWYERTAQVRAPRPGEVVEYDPVSRRWMPVGGRHG